MTDIVLDSTGLTIKTQAEMLETLKTAFRASVIGDLARIDDVDSPEGRIAAILAEMKSDLAGHLQAAVAALLPSTSTGEFLKEMIKFNGISQNVKEYSTVTLTVTANTAGCTIPAGKQVSTPAGVVFATDTEVVLGPSASTTVGATAVEAGALVAEAGTVTDILTPVYGWASATNVAAALPGNLDETDPAMRIRRWRAAVGVGIHHPSKIYTSLFNLPNVTAVALEINNGVVDLPSGVPPQHVRAIVRGGTNQDVADTLFGSYAAYAGAGSVAAGIGTYGAQSVVCTGDGQTGTIYFDRSSDVNIAIVVRTRKGASYPANGDARIRAFILELFAGTLEVEGESVEGFVLGDDIYGTRIMTACHAVPGHTVDVVYVGKDDDGVPTATSLVLGINEFPVASESLITIVGV